MKVTYDTDDIHNCYWCHELIDPEDWENDHLFSKELRLKDPALKRPVLPVHSWCNQEKLDYTVRPLSDEEKSLRRSKSTRVGMERARAAGKQIGAPRVLTEEQEKDIPRLRTEKSVQEIAMMMGTSTNTVYRVLRKYRQPRLKIPLGLTDQQYAQIDQLIGEIVEKNSVA